MAVRTYVTSIQKFLTLPNLNFSSLIHLRIMHNFLLKLTISHDHFDSTKLMDLGHELHIYIDNVWTNQIFSNLVCIAEACYIVGGCPEEYFFFHLVHRLLNLVLIL